MTGSGARAMVAEIEGLTLRWFARRVASGIPVMPVLGLRLFQVRWLLLPAALSQGSWPFLATIKTI